MNQNEFVANDKTNLITSSSCSPYLKTQKSAWPNPDQSLKQIPDAQLLLQTEKLVQEERKVTIQVLKHLREIELRRLFVELGFSSMYEYCVKHLKYSEGQAQRRISSARLLRELPEIETKIQSGSLNITNLSKVQSFLRAEKAHNCGLNKSEKLDLIDKLENKSTREVEQELIGLSHQPLLMAEKFHCSAGKVSESAVKFEMLLGVEHQELLTEFKNLYAHELTDMSDGNILIFALSKLIQQKKKKLGLEKYEQSKSNLDRDKKLQSKDTQQLKTLESSDVQGKSKNAAPLPSAPKVKTHVNTHKLRPEPLRRAIPITLQRQIWQRAKSFCEYLHPRTGSRCASRFALQIDHVQPLSLGGANDFQNLRLLCRVHNSRRVVAPYGFRGLPIY